MDKKRYVIRLEDNIQAYIENLAKERGLKPVNIIKSIIADQKMRDEAKEAQRKWFYRKSKKN